MQMPLKVPAAPASGPGLSFRDTLLRDARHHLWDSFYIHPLPLTPVRLLRTIVAPEFQLVLWFRVYTRLHWHGSRTVAYLLYLACKTLTGCDLSPGAVIGAGLRIPHPSDIVIGEGVRIGDDAVIFNGVTLGNRLGRHGEGMPIAGNRVMFGTGAKILGPVALGDDVLIGANAVVLNSVPAGRSAVGNPARIVEPRSNPSLAD